jgi:hypothetical protein
VDVRITAFGDTTANDGKVFVLSAARRMGVDKSGPTGAQLATMDNTGFHFLRVRFLSSLVMSA